MIAASNVHAHLVHLMCSACLRRIDGVVEDMHGLDRKPSSYRREHSCAALAIPGSLLLCKVTNFAQLVTCIIAQV
uniref:Uncharacterized protein n=1 Tax=Arundo donax TaxID=35708 RepID=A0A0A9E6U8_ARUDO